MKKENKQIIEKEVIDLMGMFSVPSGISFMETTAFSAFIEDLEKLEEFFEADSSVKEEEAKNSLEKLENILCRDDSWGKDKGMSLIIEFQKNKDEFMKKLRGKIKERSKEKQKQFTDTLLETGF